MILITITNSFQKVKVSSFQGILFTTGDAIKQTSELIRLWLHEATRVYSDKLVDSTDNETFAKLISDTIKKNCEVPTPP